ncbi:hypothetical protein AB6A40_010945 [Gnathostoma spinigerum]|uniref:Uncharacterized protein n=1 Tax=Gnathostoma spinigerum TaxID=75299 RepID=A0ABD6F244_9BILA
MTIDVPELNANETEVENFLIQIMRIDSTSRNEERLSQALTRYFKATGWNIIQQPLKTDPKRHNLLVTREPFIPPGPRYVMNTHMDTVPPFLPPESDGTFVHGRGANDAKGNITHDYFFCLCTLFSSYVLPVLLAF